MREKVERMRNEGGKGERGRRRRRGWVKGKGKEGAKKRNEER